MPRHLNRAAAVLGLAIIAAGCNAQTPGEPGAGPTASANAPAGRVVARVNGTAITAPMLELYIEQRRESAQGELPPRAQLLEELIAQELLAQAAREQGLDETPAIRVRLVNLRRHALAQAAIGAHVEAHPIGEQAMRDTYDTEVEKLDLTEYKARHILVDEQAQALALIERLEQGADFAELAREASTGPSGRQGGDLGWFTRRQMVPAFGEAVAGLEPGAFTREPVETRFGWHVILLEDTREAPAPGFGEVKEGVREALEKRALRDYVETLHAEADIEILEPAAEKDASAGGGAAAGDGGGEPEPSPPQ